MPYKYHPPAKGYGQSNKGWAKAETLRKINLPGKIRCDRCGRFKTPDNFSEKQKKKLKSQIHDHGSNAKLAGVNCMICSGAPPTEMECHMCHEYKDLDQFSNSQRRNVDKPKCRKCMDEQVAFDPANPTLPFDMRYDERFGHRSESFDTEESWFHNDAETEFEAASTMSSLGRTEEYESLSEDTDVDETMSKVGFRDDESDNETVTGTQSPLILDRDSYNQVITKEFVRGVKSSKDTSSSLYGSSGFNPSTSGRSGTSGDTKSSVSTKLRADGWMFDSEDEDSSDEEEEITYRGRGGQDFPKQISPQEAVSFPESENGRRGENVGMPQFGGSTDTVLENMSNLSFASSTAPPSAVKAGQQTSAHPASFKASGNISSRAPHRKGMGDWIG